MTRTPLGHHRWHPQRGLPQLHVLNLFTVGLHRTKTNVSDLDRLTYHVAGHERSQLGCGTYYARSSNNLPALYIICVETDIAIQQGLECYTVLAWWHWDRQCGMKHVFQLAGITILWLVGLNMYWDCLVSYCIIGSRDRWEFPPFSMTTSSNGTIFHLTGPLCGEFIGPGEFPAQRPVTRSFDVFLDLRLNKRLSKQPWGWWFETPSW